MVLQADCGLRTTIAQCVEAINLCCMPDAAGNEEHLALLCSTVLEAIHALLAQPYKGKGRGLGTSTPSGYRSPWEDVARWAGRRDGGVLGWKDRLLVLLDGAQIEADEMLGYAEHIRDPILHNHVVLHVIEELVADGAFDHGRMVAAKHLRPVPSLDGDSRYQGYRVLLRHFAGQGDAEEFFAVWPQCAAGRDRHEIELCKSRLIVTISARQGWEAALALCDKDRRLGRGYYGMALRPLIEVGTYETLRQVLRETPGLELGEQMELSLLVHAYAAAARRGQQDIGEFQILFERVSALDPKIKAGDVRLRDSMFCELGRIPPDIAWRKRCNAATKNPALRWKLDFRKAVP